MKRLLILIWLVSGCTSYAPEPTEDRRWYPRAEWNYRAEGDCTRYGGVC